MSSQSNGPRDTLMLAVLLAGLVAAPVMAQSPSPAGAPSPPAAGGDGQATRDLLNQAQTAAERRAVEDLIERLRTGGAGAAGAAPAVVAPGAGAARAGVPAAIAPTVGAPTVGAPTVGVPAVAPAAATVPPPTAGRAAGAPLPAPTPAVASPSIAGPAVAPGAPAVGTPAQPATAVGAPPTSGPVTNAPLTGGPITSGPSTRAPGAAVPPPTVAPATGTPVGVEPATAVPASTAGPAGGAAVRGRVVRGQPAAAGAAAVVVAPGADPMAQAPELADKLNLPRADFEIYFDFNSADITPKALAQLTLIGQALSDPRLVSARFLIGGHTDARGRPDINLTVSRRRAEAVRKFLIDNYAVDPARLAARGYGKQRLKLPRQPLAEENRRVQIINWTGQPVADVFR